MSKTMFCVILLLLPAVVAILPWYRRGLTLTHRQKEMLSEIREAVSYRLMGGKRSWSFGHCFAGVAENRKRKGWSNMNKLGMLLTVGMVLVGVAVCRADTKTTIRDSQGRITATVTTDRNGKKTIRDSLGRLQGTEATDRNGKTTYRDASGHVTGSQQTDKNGKTTYRDCLGRMQGTKTVDRNGKVTWRDAAGRIQGTATTDRNGNTTYRDGSGRLVGTRKVR